MGGHLREMAAEGKRVGYGRLKAILESFVMGRLFMLLAASAALADPLETAVRASGDVLCFTRTYNAAWLKAHPGQTLRSVRLAINWRDDTDGPDTRLHIQAAGRPAYVFGECQWFQGDANRSAQGDILDPTFKPDSGLGCMVFTDTTGSSAEEGGWFQGAWQDDGRALQLHFQDSMAAWRDRSFDREPTYVELGAPDRITRLQRAAPERCADLLALFPKKG